MAEANDRKSLKAEYRDAPLDAGVYRIVNTQTGRGLIGSTTSLRSVRNRLEFARSTNSPGTFDQRLKAPIQEYGIASFEFEVLERLGASQNASRAVIQADLATLEQLWREKLGADLIY